MAQTLMRGPEPTLLDLLVEIVGGFEIRAHSATRLNETRRLSYYQTISHDFGFARFFRKTGKRLFQSGYKTAIDAVTHDCFKTDFM